MIEIIGTGVYDRLWTCEDIDGGGGGGDIVCLALVGIEDTTTTLKGFTARQPNAIDDILY